MAILKPYSYNGAALQSSDYDTSFPRSSGMAQIQSNVSYTNRAGATPVIAGKSISPVTMNVEILCLHDTMTLLEGINSLFDTKDEQPRQFIATDEEDTQKQYYVYATPRQVMGGHDGNRVVVTLALDDPIWQSVTLNSDTDTVSDTTDTFSVTVGGNDYAYPIFEITPTTGSSDYPYNDYVQVLPRSTLPYINRPLFLQPTSSTWDTAALIAAGKMSTDGSDVRVANEGIFIDYQLSGINTTDTKILVRADMPEKRTLLLSKAMTDSTTDVRVAVSGANSLVFDKFPATGRLVIYSSLGATDTEEIVYSSKIKTTTYYAFIVDKRGERNTVPLAHSLNHIIQHLPYDFNILYGKPDEGAWVSDSDTLPIIDPDASTNSSFVYTQFSDNASIRAGEFTPEIISVSKPTLSRSTFYTSSDDNEDVDPAEVMGLKTLSYEDLGVWKADTVNMMWKAVFPDYIASVSGSGQQSQNIAAKPAHSFIVSKPATPTTYVVAATIAAQSSSDFGTFTSWTKATTDFVLTANTYTTLAFRALGTLSSTTDTYAKIECDALTVNLSNSPHVVFRGEAAAYKIDCTITNENTGESIKIIRSLETNKAFTIDTNPDFPYASYGGVVSNGAVTLSAVRAAWLKMAGGATNTFTFVSNVGAASVQIVTKWRDRLNFF